MNKNLFLRTLTLLLVFTFVNFAPSFARIVDRIVAVVNDEVITQSEVDRVLYPLYVQFTNIYKTEQEVYERLDEARLDILKQLISDKLILSEAKKLEVKVAEKEIDEEIEQVKKDLLGKGMDLDDLLRDQSLTVGDLRNKYKNQIMIQKVIDQQIRSRIGVQPSEISNYYLSHIGDYTEPAQVAVYTILIRLKSERMPVESHQLAADVHGMLMEGRDFQELARNYSEGPHREEGGDLSYVERGQLLKEIDNVIFFLKTGEISDVIETPIGYHIFKIYDRKEEKVIPFGEVRRKVMETIYQTKAQKKFHDWLDKLKSNAYISIK